MVVIDFMYDQIGTKLKENETNSSRTFRQKTTMATDQIAHASKASLGFYFFIDDIDQMAGRQGIQRYLLASARQSPVAPTIEQYPLTRSPVTTV